MNELARFYINDTARAEEKAYAQKLADSMPEANVYRLSFPVEPIPKSVTTAVVVGGDGSVRSIAEALLERDEPGNLLLIPGGSQNGFYRSLLFEGSIVTPAQLAEGALSHIPEFRPGLINEYVFCHAAEVGKLMQTFAGNIESLRGSHIPRDLKAYLAAAQAGIAEFHKDGPQPALRIAMTAKNLGPLNLLPNQSLYSNDLSLLTIMNTSRREGAKEVVKLLRGSTNLQKVCIELAREFTISNEDTTLTISGEIFPSPQNNELHIRRSEKSLRAAVLQTN